MNAVILQKAFILITHANIFCHQFNGYFSEYWIIVLLVVFERSGSFVLSEILDILQVFQNYLPNIKLKACTMKLSDCAVFSGQFLNDKHKSSHYTLSWYLNSYQALKWKQDRLKGWKDWKTKKKWKDGWTKYVWIHKWMIGKKAKWLCR